MAAAVATQNGDGGAQQYETDLVAAMQTALVNFDGVKVEAVINAGFDPRQSVDKSKERNALHELVLNYVSYPVGERPAKLHLRFMDIVTVLKESGLDVNDVDCRHQTALHLAAGSAGHSEILRVLIGSGLRVNQPDLGQQTALHKAAVHGSPDDVTALLEAGADPRLTDNSGHSALHLAAKRKNNGAVLELLVRRGADVNLNHSVSSKQQIGATALHVAARYGNVSNAERLLDLGANPNIPDASGQTPLHVAASHEITGRLVKLLVRRGALIDVPDNLLRETALHKAVRANMTDNVAVLLRCGASLQAGDCVDDTALHKAAAMRSSDLTVWNMLLSAGASASRPNRDGLSAAQRAHTDRNKLAVLQAFEPRRTTAEL